MVEAGTSDDRARQVERELIGVCPGQRDALDVQVGRGNRAIRDGERLRGSGEPEENGTEVLARGADGWVGGVELGRGGEAGGFARAGNRVETWDGYVEDELVREVTEVVGRSRA